MPNSKLKPCCREEARKNVRRHASIATCEGCGALLLGYSNEEDFQKTLQALKEDEREYAWDKLEIIWVVSKQK